MQETVRKAEAELEKLEKEKAKVLRQWHATVLAVGKRDEAIKIFQDNLAEQHLKIKSADIQIKSTKQEIIRFVQMVYRVVYLLFAQWPRQC